MSRPPIFASLMSKRTTRSNSTILNPGLPSRGLKNTPFVTQYTPSIPVNSSSSVSSITMAPQCTLLQELGIETQGLSSESKKLATTIMKGISKLLEQEMAKERAIYNARIDKLEDRITTLIEAKDDLENYGRRNTIVISGSAIDSAVQGENCIQIASDLITNHLNVPILTNDIDVAHRLGKPRENSPDKRPIIVKIVRRANKHLLLQASRVKKPVDVYFNESVSKTRSTILYVLRKAKKDYPHQIGPCKTEDGNVRVMIPHPDAGGGSDTRSRKETVNTRRELDKLLLTRIGADSSKFNPIWPKL